MADDIFDQVAKPAPSSSTGDIFDAVAATPSDKASSAPPPEPDYAHPAGATAPLNPPAPRPMQLPLALDPTLEDKANQQVKANIDNFGAPVKNAVKEVGSGAKDVFQSAEQDFQNSHGNPFAKLPDDVAKQNRDKALGGAAKLISGGGTLAFTAEAPAVLEVATKALAGDVAAKIALAKIAASVGIGTGASAAGGAVADKYNVSPGAKNLIQAVSFFVPSLMGLAAGLKTGTGVDVEGNPAAGASAFGGKVRAGAVATPEAYDVRAAVGDTKFGVKIPRSQPTPPPPDPASILSAQEADAGTNAIVRAATKANQARQVVNGGPPPPPPGPPMPDGMKDGVISPEVVQNIAQAIHIAPVEQHPQLLMEAHGKLTEYIQKQGRIIGPDGKLAIAETPQQAAKLAQNIINDEVDRQSQAREDAAKATTEAVEQQQKDATTPGENGELSPADKQWARAKTIIESTTPKEGQTVQDVLQRSLKVSPQTADQMVQRHASETAEAQLPTVGSKQEPVVEEAKSTVDAQLDALKRGDTKVVMLPQGSRYMPEVPKGLKMMSVDGDAAGAGKYIYDPKQIKAATIKAAAKAGTHGDLLGHVQTKEEFAAQPEKPTVVVQAQDKTTGATIQDSEVHPERVDDQVAAMKERHPDAKVVVKPTHEIIADRLAAERQEQHPTYNREFNHKLEADGTPIVGGRFKFEDKFVKYFPPIGDTGWRKIVKSKTNVDLYDHETESGHSFKGDGALAQATDFAEKNPIMKGDVAPKAEVESKGDIFDEVAKSAESEPATERRTDAKRRQAVSEMSAEDMRKELLTSPVVDLPNKRAFDEAQAAEPAKAVAMSDADGLKALNDKFGYEAGNELLRAKAEALRSAGLDAYHDKGDEFMYRGESADELKTKLDAARAILRDRIIQVTKNDGSELQFSGADFSYGAGDDLNAAESGLKEHKSEREASGERARGELRGITEVEPEGRKVDKGSAPAVAKPSAKGAEMKLTQDYGVQDINGYSDDPEREEGTPVKDRFLGDTKKYLKAVSDELKRSGFSGTLDKKGKELSPVSVNESGPAGSGDVTLRMTSPTNPNTSIFATIGASLTHGVDKTKQGVTVMFRREENGGKRLGTNVWAPVDLTAGELANKLIKEATGLNREDLAKTQGITPAEPVKKGDLVTAKDIKGKDQTGKIAFTDGRITRIKTAADKEITVKTSTVTRAVDHSQPTEPKEDRADAFLKGYDDKWYESSIRNLKAEDGGHIPTFDELRDGFAKHLRDVGEQMSSKDFARSIAHATGDFHRNNVANKPTKAENEPNVTGNADTGAGREATDAGSGDREALAERPASVLSASDEGERAEATGTSDSPDVRERVAAVPVEGAGSGSGAGSDSGIDSAPGLAETEKATKALAKVVKLNTDWFSHPADFSVPTGEMGKLDANMKALRILRDVEKTPRKLTDDEKYELAQFAGWGSLSKIFNPYGVRDHQQQMRWRTAATELRTLLSPDEMQAAERSTMNAHYTSPEVVRWMWDIAKRLGFKGGTVLEPSMGSGNFFGMMPKGIRAAATAIGNELDPLTAAIAKQLYPSAQLYNKDFVELILADNSVDFAIGNVPFGVKIHDPKYPKLKAQIHDYFFIKSIDKVRPGGIVSYITSTGSMDKIDTNIRELIASRADLVAAFRLPSTAFKAVAGTDVTTDLMIFRKRAPGQPYKGEPFVQSVEMRLPNREKQLVPIRVSEYYRDHPDNMLGVPAAASTMYGGEGFALEPHEGKSMKDLLDKALRSVPVGSMDVQQQGSKQADTAAAFAPDNIQEGQYVIEKGRLLQRAQGKLIAPPVIVDKFGVPSLRKMERIKGMIGLRDKLNGILTEMKLSPNTPHANANIQKMADGLKKDYDAFVAKNGLLNAPANNVFEDDPHYPRLLALEHYDKATKISVPADIFTKRTIFPRESLSDISNDPKEALQQVLGESGHPDVALIAQLQGKPVAEVAKALVDKGLVFRDPLSGRYELPTNYLSGYVRDKLADAQAAVKQGLTEYQRNVDALTKALPETIPVKEINIRLGQTWIPTESIETFIREVMNSPSAVTNAGGVWTVDNVRNTAEVTSLYGVPKRTATELMVDMLNQRQATINFPPDSDGKTSLDVDATNAARAMQEKIGKAFKEWAVQHKTYATQYEQLYNYAYNNLVHAEHDGSHMTFPGMVKEMNGKPFEMQSHQKNVAWMLLQDGRGFVAHTVGAGKTFATIATVMEGKRLGLAKKQMVAVPNHLVGQWRKEWMALYPGATLLVPTKDDFNAKNRNKIMAKIATGEFDAVILPHSQFDLMDISAERQEKTFQGEMNELSETIRALEKSNDQSNKRTVKQMQKARENLRTKMAKLKDLKADKTINFDELGVDKLFVDEAHEYKNLSFYTKMQRVSGLGQSSAKKATRLLMKTQYLQDTYNGRGVNFLSGTPVQNTMAELYTQNKYVAPDVLQKAGIRFFDDWAANFGEAITNMELSADGRSYKARTKFAQFVNVPELMQMFRAFTDVKMKDDLNLPTPKVKNGGQTVISVPASDDVDEYVKGLMERALNVSGKGKGPKPDPSEDNMLMITSDGRKAATDMRLISSRYPDDPDSKINQAVDEIFRTHQETKEDKSTQAVFLDMYRAFSSEFRELEPGVTVIKPKVRLNLYEDMRDKLIRRGVPKDEIAIITEAKSKEEKQRIFDKMNSGELRILFGSTQKMGAGMNAQRRMIRLHNIDLPWRPGDLEQRRGRIERQGNLNDTVDVSNYLTTKSFDAYMAQTLETKASFIYQVLGGKYKGRTMIDAAGPQVMAMEEMKIAASGNPDVKLKLELERKLVQLESLERSYESSRYSTLMRASEANSDVARLNGRLAAVDDAAAKYAAAKGKDGEGFQLDVDGKKFVDREKAFEYLKAMPLPPGNFYLTMQGQGVSVTRVEARTKISEDELEYTLPYTGGTRHTSPQLSMESLGRSIESRLRNLPDLPKDTRDSIAAAQERAEKMKRFANQGTFDQADELKEAKAELAKVNGRLGIGNDLDGNLALTTAVTAEADNSGDTADEAEEEEEDGGALSEGDEKPEIEDKIPSIKPGVVLRSSVFGLDKLAEFMGDQGAKLWEKEIAPHIPATVDAFKKAANQTSALLYPRIGANEDALDSMFRTKGEREKARFMLDRMEGGLEKFFDKMPEEGRLAFIDRYKLGVGQLDPKLQKIEDLMRSIDQASFDRAKVYKPSMTAKEDHYRVLWKVIPDKNGTYATTSAKGGVGQGRRPFEGDKGFMKRSTLDTISEGINYGGVPISTNPWKMFTLAQSSIMQYITAQDHWADLKSLGLRKFVKPGTQRPEGWVKLDDRIAKAFFPASSGEGMIQAGEWYLEPTAGRILNNYLSRDLVRENAIGKALMAAKNLSTAVELGMSPFHFLFESVEAIGSQFGLGVQRFWNNGVRMGESAEMTKGLKEIATSLAAPVLTARAGGNMLKLVDDPTTFMQSKAGAHFLKQYPDAMDMLDDLFTGGYQWGMNPDYKFDPMKSMQETLTDKNYGGAMLRLVPWVNHVVMAPLFEHYIPRLKLGFALAQYSQQLAENEEGLSNGDVTRAAIARKVIDTAENRFGEMNFSNIMWNNTFKSVAQFLFRSITWKLGNWRGLSTAAGPEAYHAFADPIKQMIDDAKTGTKRPFGERLPKLGMNQAWLVGMAAATAVLGTILAKTWTGKYPWELAQEDDKMSLGGAMLLESTHPRTGQVDWHTGKPERISLPTGFKDFEHAYLHPREYVRGSMSGTAGSFVDLLENRDFFNNYVYDPNAPLYQQVAEATKYALPKPIATSALTDKHGGQDTETKALKFAGLAPTSRERDLSPAEERMQEIRRARMTPLTPQQVKERQDEDAIVKTPTVRSMHAALKKGHQEYVQKEFQNMSYVDAREVYYNLATPAEQRILKPLMDKKRMSLLRKSPDALRRADAQ